MKVKLILILTGLLFVQVLLAQNKNEIIEFGDNAYKNENYASAVFFYKKIIDNKGLSSGNLIHPYEARTWIAPAEKSKSDTVEVNKKDSGNYSNDALILHKLANSYRKNFDYQNAEYWYSIAINYPVDNIEFDVQNSRFWYGEALMKNEKYDEASIQFEQFKKETADMEMSARADKNIMGCYYATDPSSTIEGINLQQSDTNINIGTSSYGLNFFGDEMSYIFSAAGPNGVITDEKKQNSNFLSDFYLSQRMMDEGWGEATNMQLPINSENNEGAGVLSIDRTTFYFTRKSGVNNKDVAIYISKFFNNQWMQPLKINDKVNVEGYKSMHPALSMEGDILYFSSNRPGGKGGMDIWYCNIDDYGGLSEPINLLAVNTTGDEVTPFFNYFTKTLYFSSDALGGMGGLDIYKSAYNEDEDYWATPKNIGKPFNSSKDDAYFVINKDQSEGYLSSDRMTCDCGDDYEGSNYCYRIFEFGQPEMIYTLSGTVFNAETDEVIPNALITFKDIRGKMDPVFITTDENGNYKRDLEVGWELFMKAQKAKYFGDAASLSTAGLTESKHFIQDFFLSPIPMGEIEIPGIEYDFDAATLRPKSKEILDKLVEFLELNNNIAIEIRSHTDSRGNDAYNLKLSDERAASVVKYLVAHGINKNRLESKGMGETEPLDDCSKYPECGDTRNDECDCHQKNRRTAFKTTSEDFKDVFKEK
jgi:outer membrane protein OmpA-like peptidoglycan-associated protein/tetratricopeptide (TPR) repeat protein